MLDRSQATGSPQGDRNTETRAVAFRGAGFMPKAGRYAGWIVLAAVIGLWQLAGSAGWINPLVLPAPSAIARAIYQLAISGALWHHLSY
jgi:ABC-type nitrate/sulfonate/bicarbonate transport system permease component